MRRELLITEEIDDAISFFFSDPAWFLHKILLLFCDSCVPSLQSAEEVDAAKMFSPCLSISGGS